MVAIFLATVLSTQDPAPLPAKPVETVVTADAQGARWGEAIATRDDDVLRVQEIIQSADGQAWSDVAAWYWQASLGHASGPYLSILVASADPSRDG